MVITGSIFSMAHVNLVIGSFFSLLTGDISFTLLCDNIIDESFLCLEIIAHNFGFVGSFSILEYRRAGFYPRCIGHTSCVDCTAVHIHGDNCRSQLDVLIIDLSFPIKMCIPFLRKDNGVTGLIDDRGIQRLLLLSGICGQCIHPQRIHRQ